MAADSGYRAYRRCDHWREVNYKQPAGCSKKAQNDRMAPKSLDRIQVREDDLMGWIESIQKAIEYIEDHITDDLSIEQIAKEANASVFHFQRTFSILTNMSIGEYSRKRRLTLAAKELQDSGIKVIDIALKYGYDTPEAFAKAFRKQHGIAPSDVRKGNVSLKSYNRLTIQVTLKGVDPMKYKLIEKESFQVAGVKRTYSTANNEQNKLIPRFWEDVHADGTNDRLAALTNGEIEGILGVCVAGEEEDCSQMIDYWIAASFQGDAPEGLDILNIPASKWAVFEVHGPMPAAMQNAWKQIFSEWFPSHSYRHAGTPEFEYYPHEDPYQPDAYSEIWIPIK